MKKKLTALAGKIRSGFTIRVAVIAIVIVISVIALIRFSGLFVLESPGDPANITVSSENVIENLAAIMKFPPNELFTEKPPVDSVLLINKEGNLIYRTAKGDLPVAFEKGSNQALSVSTAAEQNFDSLVIKYFQLPGYAEAISNPDSAFTKSAATSMATAIGADPELVTALYQGRTAQKNIRSILLFLIYNTVINGDKGHIATTIDRASRKMKSIKEADYRNELDIIDKSKLEQALTYQNTKNEITSFVTNEFYKIYPDKKEQRDPTRSVPRQQKTDAVFGTNTIMLNPALPFDFVYINQRTGVLYCGEHAVSFDPNSSAPKDMNKLAAFFEKEFSVKDSSGALETVETIASRIGTPYSMSEPEQKDRLPALFKTLINYTNAKPDIYIVSAGRLQTLSDYQKGRFLLGHFDELQLELGMGKLEESAASDPAITIVKKDLFTQILVYAALILLPLLTAILLYFPGVFAKKTVAVENKVEEPESIETEVVENEDPAIQEVIAFLNNSSAKQIKNKELDTMRKKLAFYEKAKNSDESGLAELINNNTEFSASIYTRYNLLDSVKKEKRNVDKINRLLKEYDNYAPSENLVDYYKNQTDKNKKHDKLSELLTNNNDPELYSFLKGEIEKTEKDPSIENLVKFALLFKSSATSKFKSADHILKEYRQVNQSIDAFISHYRQLSNPADPKLLERIAINLWALELSKELAATRNTSVNTSSDKIRQDQLYLALLKLFINAAKNRNNAEKVFDTSLEDLQKKIDEHNLRYTDQLSTLQIDEQQAENIEQLKSLVKKIVRQEKTENAFQKFYQHFIKGFNEKIDKLGFTAADLNAEDRSWLYEQLFNITFHTVDLVEHFKKGDAEEWHSNLIFLLNDLELNKTEHKEFIENNMTQSSNSSNAVVKAARFGGVKKLSVLVDKYYITPEQLAQ